MAKEIEELKVSGMTNGAHFDYMSMTAETAEADSVVSAKAKDETAALRAALAEEDECLQLSRKNALSDRIAEQDALRDQYYSGYKSAVKAMRSMPEGDMLTAAETLWQHLKDYGIDTKAQLNDETGKMTNLCADLAGKLKAEVATLGLTTLAESMSAANTEVHDLMMERNAEESTKVAGALKSARKATDAAYKSLIKKVNALALIDTESDYTAFIDTMNEQIEQYRQKVLARKKSSAASAKTSATTTSETA